MTFFNNIFNKFDNKQREYHLNKQLLFNKKEQFKYLKTRHSYHLVDPSPWPLFVSLASLSLTSSAVLYFHMYSRGGFLLFFSFIMLILVMSF